MVLGDAVRVRLDDLLLDALNGSLGPEPGGGLLMDFAPPILVCALAVAGLLVAEYRDSRAGLWLTKPLASAAFVWLAVAAGALASTYGRLVLLHPAAFACSATCC